MRPRLSEEDLAARVVTWLEAEGWEVFQEVTTKSGPRCDIVAVRGPLTWAIETKVQMGLLVLEQAHHWLWRANLVSVATGHNKNQFAHKIAADYGIGIIEVGDGFGEWERRVKETLPPQLHRPRLSPLRAALREEQKTWAKAGNATSSFYSPWRGTVRALQTYLEVHGSAPLKQVVEGITHHYGSAKVARACLRRNIEDGLVEGVRLVRDGRLLRVEPVRAGAELVTSG